MLPAELLRNDGELQHSRAVAVRGCTNRLLPARYYKLVSKLCRFKSLEAGDLLTLGHRRQNVGPGLVSTIGDLRRVVDKCP